MSAKEIALAGCEEALRDGVAHLAATLGISTLGKSDKATSAALDSFKAGVLHQKATYDIAVKIINETL